MSPALGALLALGAGIVWTLLVGLRELLAASALGRSQDLEGFERAAGRLPRPQRAIAEELGGALRDGVELERALAEALRQTTASRLGLGVLMRCLVDCVWTVLACLPLFVLTWPGLEATLGALRELEALPRGRALLDGPALLDVPLDQVAGGFALGGVGLGLLAVHWAIRAALTSPSAREARLMHALLRGSTTALPAAAAAVPGRMAEALAPNRGIERPALASGVALLCASLAWLTLVSAAPAEARRDAAATVSVWPGGPTSPIELPPWLELPRAGGGLPISDPPPVLLVGSEQAILGRILVPAPDEESPPEAWLTLVRQRISDAGGLPKGDRLAVAASPRVPASWVLELLELLEGEGAAEDLLLLYRRREDDRQVWIRARFDAQPAGALALDGEETSETVRAHVRNGGVPPPVWAEPSPSVTWGELLEKLGRLDATCATEPCPLPGLGVRVWLRASL